MFIYFALSSPFLYSFEGFENRNLSETSNQNIIVVSDTQSPLWIEELFLTSNNNEEARKHLFDNILHSRPDAVFHLGDLVDLGYSDDSWQAIDSLTSQLLNFQIPFCPTLGNHELLIFPETGEQNFTSRFPFYSKTGYMKQIGPIKFILLNSNFSDLSDEEIIKQQKWFEKQLAYCDTDSSVKAIIVGCHHPPFTNSKIVNPDEDVQQYFLPAFIRSKKSVLFLSGHSHSFEHFNRSGKDFLTIGGGGGLQHPLYPKKESLFKDLIKTKISNRNFHYLQLSIFKTGFNVKVQMLSPDFSMIETAYEINYNFFDTYIVETK
jgi:3',5'-cyclic AMP phosphodiesterase CpdA